MVSDSIIPSASVAAKDFSKKKRANRSAKLKQCKLDARREQWLSQGAAVKNKGSREEPTVAAAGRRANRCESENEKKNVIENLQARRGGEEVEKENDGSRIYHDFDVDSPSNSPTGGSVLSGTDAGTNFIGSSSSSSSSSSSHSSGGCCSGSITEEEEEEVEVEGDDNCLDDWEAVADALAADDHKKQENHNDNSCPESEPSSSQLGSDAISNNSGSSHQHLKQEEQRTVLPRLAPGNSRAWRPDDAFRPQSLPNLSKQRSFPNTDRHYGHGGGGLPWRCSNVVNLPSSCPICCEELDGTDTSFLPCICGFRLCLFCYNKILQVDGRCPACRKNYEDNPVQSELSDNGGCMTFRLPRSYSMVARSS